jgi:hypothetical protein
MLRKMVSVRYALSESAWSTTIPRESHLSSSGDRKQTRVQKLKPQSEAEKRDEKTSAAPELSAEMELTSDLAQQLQPAVGNEALKAMMSTEQDEESEHGRDAAQDEEHDHDQEIGQDDEFDLDQDLTIPSFGGSPGAPDASGENPWTADQIFGGEDDPDNPTARPRRKPRGRRRRKLKTQDELIEQATRESEVDPSVQVAKEVTRQLPPLTNQDFVDRSGDALFDTIEDSLRSPASLGRPDWRPEDLIEGDFSIEPLMMSAEVGSFLGKEGVSLRARSISRLLGSAQASLIPEAAGYSGAAARMASLTICAQAEEARPSKRDTQDVAMQRHRVARAVRIAMEWDAWSDTVEQARVLAAEGKLHAPLIFERASHGSPKVEPLLTPTVPDPLIRAALDHILPSGFVPSIPGLAPIHRETPATDSAVDELDAILTRLTTGATEGESPDPTVLDSSEVQPCLYATRHLLNAIGRLQVEAAAGALATVQAEPRATILPLLERTDQVLRGLARGTVKGGRELTALVGQPKVDVYDSALASVRAISEIEDALRALQEWTKSSLAASVSG